jgi:hypothetical protein
MCSCCAGCAEKEGLATAVGIAAEAAAAVRVVHAFALEDAVSRQCPLL